MTAAFAMDSKNLPTNDAKYVWHPATHFCDLEELPPLAIEHAQGSWLHTCDGQKILDGISSWWTCIHGHGHPKIVQAITQQAKKLDHVMFAGFTHEPAVKLAQKLIEMAPSGFGKVFFADCGSAAIEIALKMSVQYRKQSGENHRDKIASLTNSYHGETLGALAACGGENFRQPFSPMLMDITWLPTPNFPNHGTKDVTNNLGAETTEAQKAVEILEKHSNELTAVIIEPLIQCAGKMAMPGVGYYRTIVEAAQALGIHVIADEIAVGFGRTGKLFASEWAAVRPDFLCLSKGLSGGVLPLSSVLIDKKIEAAFHGSPARSFLHSHTFTGNPLACAAAVASLEVFAEEQTLASLETKIATLNQLRQQVSDSCPAVQSHRQLGMVAAFDVALPNDGSLPDHRLSFALRKTALQYNVLLRPLHNTVYWMPPLSITEEELLQLADATTRAIDAVCGGH